MPGMSLTIETTGDGAAPEPIRTKLTELQLSQMANAEVEAVAPVKPSPLPAPEPMREPERKPVVGTRVRINPGKIPIQTISVERVVGGDGPFWFVWDTKGRPMAIRYSIEGWQCVEMPPVEPRIGDVVLTGAKEHAIAEALGEAVIGGWLVKMENGRSAHVLMAGEGRWRFLQYARAEETPHAGKKDATN